MTIDIFMNARDARAQAISSATTITEVRAIELAILAAVEANQLSVVVGNTPMTTPAAAPDTGPAEAYFRVWQNINADRAMQAQMDTVIRYFTDYGYSITRLINTETNATFVWSVQW